MIDECVHISIWELWKDQLDSSSKDVLSVATKYPCPYSTCN